MITSKFSVKSNEKLISRVSNSFPNLHPLTTKAKIAGVYTVNANIWLPDEEMKEKIKEDAFTRLSKDYYLRTI